MNKDENPVLQSLEEIEKKTGPLSNAQRALLTTDGSITRLLEVFCKGPVSVRTVCQEVIRASEDVAQELEIKQGEEVNHRVVDLFNQSNNTTLIHAVSYTPLMRLPDGARSRLMNADEPIGIILRDEKIESRRELISVHYSGCHPWNPEKSNTIPSGPYLSRKYRIIHNNLPLFFIEEMMPVDLFSGPREITIRTPSRIHLGLLDMNGSLGRVDGGAGITLEDPGFDICVSESDILQVSISDKSLSDRVLSILTRIEQNGYTIPPMRITIAGSIPFHCGLGSGTQLALALATGVAYLNRKNSPPDEIISMTGRGGTSGIGVRAFTKGGLIVDAGHRFGSGKHRKTFAPSSASSDAGPAPLVGSYPFPEDWNIVLAIPSGLSGVNGEPEKEIFNTLCPVPLEEVRKISHLVLMKLIPATIEQDLDEFGDAVNHLQEYGFKRCELGLQPPIITEIMESMREAGAAGSGMSSFGPVVYGICDSQARDICSAAEEIMNACSGGDTIITRGRNRGASISCR